MKFELLVKFAPVKINKETVNMAGTYLSYRNDPKLIDEKMIKRTLFLFKVYGFGSLAYLKIVALYYKLCELDYGKTMVAKSLK
jgi:hypothetical protein